MRLNNHQNFLLTIILAMCLRVAPLPLSSVNPDWILLVLIYWALALPYNTGVFHAWLVGLFVDVLIGRSLGQYALVYALISYFSLNFHKRLRQFPVLQQCLFVFACLLLAQGLIFLIESMKGPVHFSGTYWIPVLTGTLVWPFMYRAVGFLRGIGHAD